MPATTRLEALNEIIGSIGNEPLESESEVTSDSVVAGQILDSKTRQVLSTGWHFNTDENVTFTPDGSNEIVLGDNVMSIDVEKTYDTDIVTRAGKLYDRINHTYEFSSDVEASEVIYLLDFTELPQVAREYIVALSCLTFQRRTLGDDSIDEDLRQELASAKTALDTFEMDHGDHNIFNSPYVLRILRR